MEKGGLGLFLGGAGIASIGFGAKVLLDTGFGIAAACAAAPLGPVLIVAGVIALIVTAILTCKSKRQASPPQVPAQPVVNSARNSNVPLARNSPDSFRAPDATPSPRLASAQADPVDQSEGHEKEAALEEGPNAARETPRDELQRELCAKYELTESEFSKIKTKINRGKDANLGGLYQKPDVFMKEIAKIHHTIKKLKEQNRAEDAPTIKELNAYAQAIVNAKEAVRPKCLPSIDS